MTSFNKQLQEATTEPAHLGAHIYENPDADLYGMAYVVWLI